MTRPELPDPARGDVAGIPGAAGLPAVPLGSAAVLGFTVTLGLAAVSWVVTVRRMGGAMDMGVATGLGPFGAFAALWVPMTAAMMLPGASPAALGPARSGGGRRWRAVPLFVGAYLVVWALLGGAAYAVYRSHGTFAAGAVVIAAGLYEVTPFKRHCRRRCRAAARSGFAFGLSCVGSGIGLMLVPVALGVMSAIWMSLVTVVVLAQRLLPARAALDVPVALAIVGLGLLIVVAPWAVPGPTPSM
ncbi:DUF2182 domain-containing protein [Streptomyces sp. NPDC052301]|uniref:copper chaperone n=1 Tax=Streptomyces sp. NPDC052301 TaxID=3365687 RepID=UPI0037D0F1E4